MNLPRLSVRRPVLTTMVALIFVSIGGVSLDKLQIDLLPDVEVSRLSVRTDYRGASPEVVERLVTQIVEEIVGTVAGVEEISSTSSEGRSRVSVSFSPDTDVDTAAADLRAALEDEISELPDDIERPRISKFDIASFPVVIVGVSSDLAPVELTEMVENQIRDRFGRLPGVAQVDPWGGYHRQVRVEIDPDRLRSLDLPFNTLLTAIREANIDRPTGTIDQGQFEVTLRAPSEFQSVEDLRNLVVAVREGAAVTLGQVADVRDTYQKLTRYVRVNGKRGLRLAIRKESEANTVEVSEAVLAEIKRINADFPQVQIVAVSNQGNFIERSIANVARSVLYGGVLAVLVLLFFLGNLRSTAVIAVSIPISVLATLAVVYLSGLTINLMTLGGLALGVGMMVDSSIVVLENIFRRREEDGETPHEAAVSGTMEVAGAIVASTITTLVIFLPLVFVGGITGMLFREFAFVVVCSLVCSLFVALTLVPMLASRMLGNPATERKAGVPSRPRAVRRLAAVAHRGLSLLDRLYADVLAAGLRHRVFSVLLVLLLLVASLLLVPLIGSEFLPASDEGEVSVRGEMAVATRLEVVDEKTRELEQIVDAAVPEAVGKIVNVRGGSGSIDLTLSPSGHRDRSNQEIAEDLRERLAGGVAGMTIRTRAPEGQNLLNRILPSGGGLDVEIRGPDLATLDALAQRVAERVTAVEGVTDADPGQRTGTPQERLAIARGKAADVGLSIQQVAEALETAVSGREAGEYRAEGFSYPILVQIKDAQRQTLDEILNLSLRTPSGENVALRNLVTTEPGRGPVEIERKDRQRIVGVEVNVGDRDLGSVARDVRGILGEIPHPPGYSLRVAGSYEEQRESSREMLISIGLSLALVYMVLASQYESLRDPLVVMLSVPLAAVGVLLTLFLTQTTLNVQSYIGCIMLGGIVVNNAILLVDQAGHLRRDRGLSPRDAVREAGRRRLRPILMTSATTMLGLLPLAMGVGEGADAQAPLARAVIGGLLASMVMTLVIVPVGYTLVHPDKRGATP